MVLAVPAVAAAIYLPALPYHFAWDDVPLVRDNPWLRAPFSAGRFFLPSFWRQQIPLARNDYRPLQMTALSLLHRAGGGSPSVFRLANLVVHLAAGFMVWRLGRGLVGLTSGAALAAVAWFILHPLQVETVISPRNLAELLACFLALVALWAYHASFRERRAGLLRALGGGAFLLAVLTKETALILPAVLLVAALAPGKRGAWKRIAAAIPVWLIAAGFAVFKLTTMREGDILRESAGGVYSVIWEAGALAAYYLRLLMLPAGLGPLHSFTPPSGGPSAAWAAAAALTAALIVVAARLWKTQRRLALPAVIFIVTLIPSLSKVAQTGRVVAEQRMYLPSAFLVLFFAAAGEKAATSRRALKPLFLPSVAVAAAAFFALNAGIYTRAWRDPLTLWSRAVSRAPDSALARNNLAAAYYKLGMEEEAFAELEAALDLSPNHSEALNNLGVLYRRRGQLGPAEEYFRRSWTADPDYWPAALNLAEVWMQRREFIRAQRLMELLLEDMPWLTEARNVLGVALEHRGLPDQAVAAYAEAAAADPFYPDPARNIAGLLQNEGRFEESRSWAREAVRRAPDDPEGWILLARSYVSGGDLESARKATEEGLQRIPDSRRLQSLLWALRSAGP